MMLQVAWRDIGQLTDFGDRARSVATLAHSGGAEKLRNRGPDGVVWTVPGFTVDAHRDRLTVMDEQIERDGCFVAHAQRFLIEARRRGLLTSAREGLGAGPRWHSE